MEEFDYMRRLNGLQDNQSEMIEYYLSIEEKTPAINDVFFICIDLTPDNVESNRSLLDKVDCDCQTMGFRQKMRAGILLEMLKIKPREETNS